MTATNPLLAFYGDDLTGSTAVLEGLALNGVDTVMFVDPPTPGDLEAFDDIQAVGVAGTSRSMTPDEMDDALPSVFRALAALDPTVVHYKVCSTFDSAPTVGSIGKAIDVAQDVFDSPFVPVSQANDSPHGRYVSFSNLFAVQDGVTYRIDRHPTMKNHPTTPMNESDLRRHLGNQTSRPIGAVHIPDLDTVESARDALSETLDDGNEIVIVDGIDTSQLDTIGHLIWTAAEQADGPLFAVGSSGIERHVLAPRWEERGEIDRSESSLERQPPVEQIVVVSGSAAPVTAAQIDWATERGFEAIRLDSPRLVDPTTAPAARTEAISEAVEVIEAGKSPILYSVHGPDDPVIERTRRRYDRLDAEEGLGDRLGRQQGNIFSTVIEKSGIERVCVAGGDTSGAVIPELSLKTFEALAPTAPGAPLCRVTSTDSSFHGLEIALKGGQTGEKNLFELIRRGGVPLN